MIICENCGYKRPSKTKITDTKCPICNAEYNSIQKAKIGNSRIGNLLTNNQFGVLGIENNSRMTSCKDCNKDVSKAAKTCPNCGASNPGVRARDYLAGAATMLALVAAFTFWSASKQESLDPKSSPIPGLSQMEYNLCIRLGNTIIDGKLGSPEHLDAFQDWNRWCDPTALQKMIGNGNYPQSPIAWASLELHE